MYVPNHVDQGRKRDNIYSRQVDTHPVRDEDGFQRVGNRKQMGRQGKVNIKAKLE